MTKDEALKLALDALERCVATCFDPYAHEQAMSWPEHFVNQAITAIKEALAEQEQVEWGVDWGPDGNSVSIIKRLADGGIEVVGWEYAPHPSQRKPLTDEEIQNALLGYRLVDAIDIARAIESAHGIKG